MRTRIPAALAMTFPLLSPCPLRADPVDPNLKFWVQLTTPTDTAMLGSLVRHGSRIHPIIVVRTPNVFGTCSGGLGPTNAWCPDLTACLVVDQIATVTANMPLPPQGESFPIAIMIQLFGGGGRARNSADQITNYFPAPALARPPLLNLTSSNLCPPNNTADPALAANNDNLTTAPYGATWWTPWFNLGPTDCAYWLRNFAAAYSGRVAGLPGGALNYQPWRMVFDNEDDVSPVFLSENLALQSALTGDARAADAVRGQVKGVPIGGVFDDRAGPMIADLLPPHPAPPCDGCENDEQAKERLRMA